MLRIEINGWNESNGWTKWPKANLVNRLIQTGMMRRDAKDLVNRIYTKEPVSIELKSLKYSEGIRHVLESMGAILKVVHDA